jgi:hypothetical protein
MSNDLVTYEEAWSDEAKAAAAANRVSTGGRFISHRSGVFTVGDDMEFPELCAVILASAHENVWYGRAFDPENFAPPKCFALSKAGLSMSAASMGAHESTYEDDYFEPQSESCKGCPKNEWPKKGEVKQKECRNMHRLLLLPVGQYTPRKGSRDLDLDLFLGDDADENAEYARDGDAYLLKLPPTSLTHYKEMVVRMQREYNRPPHGMIMRIYTEPYKRGGHTIRMEPIGTLPDALYPHIKARIEAEQDLLMRPYTPPQEDV